MPTPVPQIAVQFPSAGEWNLTSELLSYDIEHGAAFDWASGQFRLLSASGHLELDTRRGWFDGSGPGSIATQSNYNKPIPVSLRIGGDLYWSGRVSARPRVRLSDATNLVWPIRGRYWQKLRAPLEWQQVVSHDSCREVISHLIERGGASVSGDSRWPTGVFFQAAKTTGTLAQTLDRAALGSGTVPVEFDNGSIGLCDLFALGIATSSISGQYVTEQSSVERLSIPDDRILILAGYTVVTGAPETVAQASRHVGVNEAADGIRITQYFEWPSDALTVEITGAEPGNPATSVSAFSYFTRAYPGGRRVTEMNARVTRSTFGLIEVDFIGAIKRRQSILEGEVKVSGTPDDALRINTLPWLNFGHVDHDTKSQSRYLGIVQAPVIEARLVIPLWSEGQSVPLSPNVRPGWPARFHAGTVDLTMSPVLSIRYVGAAGRVPVAIVKGIATAVSRVSGGGSTFYDVTLDVTDEDLPDPGDEPGVPPGRVDQPIVTVDSQGVVSINWMKPTGSEPFVYDIVRAVAGIDPTPPTIGIGNDVTGTLAQDTPGEGVWRYRVRAINGAGVGEWSIWNGVQVGALGEAPGQVAQPAVSLEGQLVTIGWSATTGTLPLRYQVVRAMGGITQNPPTVTVDDNILATITTDTPGVGGWRYRVRALNDYGTGDWSDWNGVFIAEPEPSQSFNLHADNQRATGIWSDGDTVWVADRDTDKIYAYNLSTKQYISSFSVIASRDGSQGIWSDSTTMWVVTSGSAIGDRNGTTAYNLSTRQRDRDQEFNAGGRSSRPRGIWSDGMTVWVSISNIDEIHAYNLNTKSRITDQDFDTLGAAGNNSPHGIWSDGTTMWVVDDVDDKIYAYSLSTKLRTPDQDFNSLAAGNSNPRGIWSDGTTMWVVDFFRRLVYAYNMSDKQYQGPPIATAAVIPGTVSQPTVSADNNNVVTISYSAPSGTPPFTFEIVRAIAGIDPNPPTTSLGSTTSLTITDTPGEGSWRYRVRAKNSAGTGGWSPWSSVTIGSGVVAPGRTSPPTLSVDGDVVTIEWLRPSGSTPIRYRVVRRREGAGPNAPHTTVGSNLAGRSITDTPGIGRWQYRVRASNSAGDGDWSEWRTAEIAVGQEAPSIPRNVTAIYSRAQDRVVVDWDAPVTGTPPITYRVYRDGGIIATRTGTSHTDNVPPGGSHVYSVRAFNNEGSSNSVSAREVVVPTEPGRVAAPAVTVSNSLITIDWNAPNVGTPPLRYDVVRAPGGLSNNPPTTTIASDITDTEVTDSPGTGTWRYRVRAEDHRGSGDWSQWVSAAIDAATPSQVDQPELSHANGLVTIDWRQPDGATPITYDVQRRSFSAPPNAPSTTIANDISQTETTNRPGAGTWRYRVRASNSQGTGAWSQWQNIVVPLSVPGPVRNLTIDIDVLPVIRADWDPPLNSPGSELTYRVYRNLELIVRDLEETEYVTSNVINSFGQYPTENAIVILAENESGLSTSVFKLVPAIPNPVIFDQFEYLAGTDRVIINWDQPTTGGEVTRYRIFRDIHEIGDTAQTIFYDNNPPSGNHIYFIIANGPGGSSTSEIHSINIP